MNWEWLSRNVLQICYINLQFSIFDKSIFWKAFLIQLTSGPHPAVLVLFTFVCCEQRRRRLLDLSQLTGRGFNRENNCSASCLCPLPSLLTGLTGIFYKEMAAWGRAGSKVGEAGQRLGSNWPQLCLLFSWKAAQALNPCRCCALLHSEAHCSLLSLLLCAKLSTCKPTNTKLCHI